MIYNYKLFIIHILTILMMFRYKRDFAYGFKNESCVGEFMALQASLPGELTLAGQLTAGHSGIGPHRVCCCGVVSGGG